MKHSDIQLPSNRKFGSFFTLIFLVVAIYFFWADNPRFAVAFALIGTAFALITMLMARVLQPLNRLWMSFGLLIGSIVSPIVLGLIFFLMFTPIALVMKLFGRDELGLTMRRTSPSHWKPRADADRDENSFKYQF